MKLRLGYTRIVLILVGLFAIIGMSFAQAAEPTNDTVLKFSATSDRANAQNLNGSIITGNVYVFAKPQSKLGTRVSNVSFFLDSEGPYGETYPWMKDTVSPYDYLATASGAVPVAANSRTVSDGQHSITVRVNYKNGTYKIHTAVFTVMNLQGTQPTQPTTPTTIPVTTPPTTVPVVPPTEKPGYALKWNDEFDGTTIDTNKWFVYPWTLSYDRSCYTANNVTVGGGVLDIRTSQDGTCGKPYSSGYIRNTELPNQLVSPTESANGVLRMEMRAQMPKWQKGIWPGLWSRNNTGDPLYGEVDLIEQWGNEAAASVVVVTSHFTKATSQKANKFTASSALDAGMHTYATEIDINNGGAVRYYIDGQLIATHVASDIAGLTQDNFLTMLKGKWDARVMVQTTGDQQAYAGGGRDDSVPLVDTHMKVDWVRYYLKN